MLPLLEQMVALPVIVRAMGLRLPARPRRRRVLRIAAEAATPAA